MTVYQRVIGNDTQGIRSDTVTNLGRRGKNDVVGPVGRGQPIEAGSYAAGGGIRAYHGLVYRDLYGFSGSRLDYDSVHDPSFRLKREEIQIVRRADRPLMGVAKADGGGVFTPFRVPVDQRGVGSDLDGVGSHGFPHAAGARHDHVVKAGGRSDPIQRDADAVV